MPALPDGETTHHPAVRRLRVFSIDPSLRTDLTTLGFNEIVLRVPRERDPRTGKDVLAPGPVGEYLEVVDYDPASGCFYAPVDLNDPELLLQDGWAPSEGNPQFHQQMVYAVAMTTIRNFERALGRCVLWAANVAPGRPETEYVDRLRIYPHALRQANAYYSPEKKAILFGYFRASATNPGTNLPGGTVFACLSHDIIAHETTHAILDGIHRYFAQPSNPDVLAFHEAFADLVALFQHFSVPEVLRSQIVRTGGDLKKQNLLGQLAQQFGQAIGRYGALRDAIGGTNEATGEWGPKKPDPAALAAATEPHDRGAVLVSAVFDAFLAVYKARVEDLLRIATGGTGVPPAGQLHPDLVNRMAEEAADTAARIQQMCIRAVDYCPPVDVTFGEFLRAVVTADENLSPEDRYGYRHAMIEAFRRRGVYPRDVHSLSPDSLRWHVPTAAEQARLGEFVGGAVLDREGREFLNSTRWDLYSDRRAVYEQMRAYRAHAHGWFDTPRPAAVGKLMGLAVDEKAPRSILRSAAGLPRVEVHSIRPARRTTADGQPMTELVVEITQRRKGFLDPDRQAKADRDGGQGQPDFWFRGGCTLLIDPLTAQVRYSIVKHVTSAGRLARQRAFLGGADGSLRATYFGKPTPRELAEPFACVHGGVFAGGSLWDE